MRTLKASFLLIGSWDARLQELGAHIATDLNQARHWIQDSTYDVIALSVTLILGKNFQELFEHIKLNSPSTQFIAVVPENFSSHQLAHLHQHYSFFKVMTHFQESHLESYLFAALEEANQRKQDEHLALLIREQTHQLKRLQIELEERVQKRTRFLTEARRKLFFTNSRIEGFKKALMAVHEASSVQELEAFLNEALAGSVQTSWIRLFFSPLDEEFSKKIPSELNFTKLQLPLFSSHEKVGSLFFLRPPEHPFTREENDFLSRVAEAVALALNRIQKLRESESLKEQWEATFNSMSDPVVLIDTNYDIIQFNKALHEKLDDQNRDTSSRKCYQVLFKRTEVCSGCDRGHNFRMQSTEAKNFDVFSQSLVIDPEKAPVFVNLYHDITQQLIMEQQILESAKMAELGTIGSSIAHELNNPLGGILSFTQLIKMEMNQENPLYPDVLEMEAGVQRCKEIIQNLLGFTRTPSSEDSGIVSLKDVILRALKIVELQTKSQGIEVKLHFPAEDLKARGNQNLLAQALKNVFQHAIDHLTDRLRQEKGFQALLDIEIHLRAQGPEIRVVDNGTLEKNLLAGLGLSVAQQIFRDHKAQLVMHQLDDSRNLICIQF